MIGSLELAAALLLGGAGLAKILAPGRVVLQLAGVAELAVSGTVIVHGGRAAAVLLGACYLVFALVTARLVRRGRRTCRCFGRAESPVGLAHLTVNAICLAIAVAAAIRPSGALGDVFDAGRLVGSIAVGQAVVLAYLGYLSITALPALDAARRHVLEALK